MIYVYIYIYYLFRIPTQDVSDFSTPRVRSNIGSTAPKLVSQLVIPFRTFGISSEILKATSNNSNVQPNTNRSNLVSTKEMSAAHRPHRPHWAQARAGGPGRTIEAIRPVAARKRAPVVSGASRDGMAGGKWMMCTLPICCMYGIVTYIWAIFGVNVGK